MTRGRGKQKIGRATGNRRLQAEGLADRISGGVRQLGEELKDEGKDIKRTFRR
ncbi:MAG: CsbD family protein [Actinomycetota bacterium]|nr:CsbD family protein [Actinomycetota bacterium]